MPADSLLYFSKTKTSFIGACPAVPPLYSWDSGTRAVSRNSQRGKLGTISLNLLKLAVLSVPFERDNAEQEAGHRENSVPGGKKAVGQCLLREKVFLEKCRFM
jgi:hypothetical protein